MAIELTIICRWLMFPVLACAWQAATGETPLAPPLFRVFGPEQGLPSSQIQALGEDAAGQLWIGTSNGLARYDGHDFKTYPARLERPHALASGSVEALLVDRRDRVWVATQGGHLARYRPQSDDFERIALAGAGSDAVPEEVWALAETGERLWVGTYGAGLLELSPDGQVLARHGVEAGLPSANVLDLVATADGALWVASFERTLARFDPVAGRAVAVRQIGIDAAFEVHGIGTHAGALWVTSRAGRRCILHAIDQATCEPLATLATPTRARMLLESERGDFTGGLGELLRERDGQAQRLQYRPGSIGGIAKQGFWVGISDRDQGLWMGTTGGGLLHLPRDADQFQVWQPDPLGEHGLLDGRIRGLARAPDGTVYLGTMERGLFRLDPASGEIDAVAMPGLSPTRVWAVLVETPQRLWVGHSDGLALYRIEESGTLTALRNWVGDAEVGAYIDLLHRDREGRIWAASMGEGLSRFDPDGTVASYDFDSHGLTGTEIQALVDGPDGALWVASDRGLLAYRASCDCFQTLLEGVRVEAIADGAGDRVFAFVDGQLISYRWRGGLFRDADVAPRSFDEFQTVGGMAWLEQRLWLAGSQGLYRYDPQRDELGSFDLRDGLATREFSDRPLLLDAGGRVWLGSEGGVVSFDPRAFDANPLPPRLQLAEISVEGQGGRRELDGSKSLRLEYGDRDLAVSARLATLARPHAQRFSFYLEGWDDDWPDAGVATERRFGALGTGRYRLRVRAFDGYGQAAANELSLRVRVAPPWWRSDAVLALYGLLGVLLVATIASIRKRRQRARAELESARRQADWAEQLAAEKGALVAELSHEIRNPLNGLLGMSRLLQGTALDARQQRFVDLLGDAGAQLTRLLDEVLDWSRIQAGHAPLLDAPMALATAIAPTLERHRQLALAKGLAFETEVDPALRVVATPARVTQILDNLVGNAIKFTPHGSIDVRARVDPVDAGLVQIAVCDSGPGFSDAERATLFKPFERGKGERSAPGTGLGLAISRALAERMGGSLVAERSDTSGARLVLRLRRIRDRSGEVEAIPASAEIAAPVKLGGRRLLMIEDDPIGREVLEAMLREWGAEVTVEVDALAALVRLQGERFDAVLLDWDLPGLSGLELGRTLRGLHPRGQPWLIAVTGRATPADRALGLEAGFDAHVAKPVNPAELNALLARLLGA